MNKSKILKIFSILVIISLVSLVAIGIVFADSVTINKKNFKTSGGTYHNAFQNKGDALFKITWDDVKNNYYTAGSTNDYRDYINPDTSPYCDGYCLNEDKGDGNQNFYVAAIIDIDGGDVTISSRKYTNTTMINVKSAANVAKAVYYRLKYPYKKSFVDNQNKWYVHNWMNSYGWGALYEDIKNKIDDACVAPNSTDEAYSKNIVDSNEYGLKIEKDGKLTIKYGDFTFNGTQYKTKIGPYKITNYVASTAQIQVVANDGTNYPGIYNNSDSYIYIKDYVTKELKSVKITQSYESYKARLIILGTGASQARMIAYAEETEINKEDSTTDVPNLQTDISLQKYITKVTSKDGTIKYNDTTKRKNKYADTNSKLTSNTSYKHQGVEISNKSGEKLNNTNNTYKSSNPVQIEAGDKVEYTIKIYNNSTVKASNVLVKDNIGNLGTMKSSYSSDTSSNYTYKIYEGEIGANATITKTVEVEYNEYTDSNIMNKAWISSTKPKNKAGYRTIDADYVQMKQYSVSLEKYVSSVNDDSIFYDAKYDINEDGYVNEADATLILNYTAKKVSLTEEQKKKADINGKDGITSADARALLIIIENATREGHRRNSAASDSKEKDEYKWNNKVEVEPGDKVTFTIKLTNTSSETSVKVSQIYDTFICYETGELNGLKLVYDTNYRIKGNGGGTISNYHYGDDKNNDNKKMDRYLIQFNNADLLAPGESTYVTIRFNVEVPKNLTNASRELSNIAGIVQLKNKNGINVTDSDGTDNNRDQDYLKTKTYAVSLEKYVTQVSDKDGNNVMNVTDREGKRYNDNATNANEKNEYKKNNKVEVEPGDKVTFTIKLTNTSSETSVKVSQIYDTFICYETEELNGLKLVYDTNYGIKGNGGGRISNYHYGDDANNAKKNIDRYLIQFNNADLLAPGESTYVTIRFNVEVPKNLTNASRTLSNLSAIDGLMNKNGKDVADSDGTDNNRDKDYIKTKIYKVSLEKYVSKVNDTSITGRDGYPIHNKDNKANTWDNTKYNNVVTVSNGDKVTYTIKVKNDGDTKAIITNIADYFPNGVEYNGTKYTGSVYCTEFDSVELNNGQTGNEVSFSNEIALEPGESKSFTVQVTVIEPNISVKAMKNVAEITGLKNRNEYPINDSTENNNKDADYIQVSHTEKEEKTEYTVKKVWKTNGNERPAQVTVKLLKVKGSEETDLGMESVVLSDENNWTYTWTDLPILDSGWKYVVRELNENGTDLLPGNGEYNDNITVTYNDNSSKKITTITNTITTPPPPDDNPEETSYSVTKVWQDDNNPDRPASVKVRLFKKNGDELVQVQKDKDGNKISDITLGSGNWSYTWNNLPKYENDKLVEYIAKEFNEKGIKVLYGKNEKNGDDFGCGYKVTYIHEADKTTIYNTKPTTETTSDDFTISGMVWNDMALNKLGNKYNGLKDDEESNLLGIEVILYRNGKGIVATTTTNENGEYRFTNANLDKSLSENERYIKGPKVAGTNRWSGEYYNYYVIFKYDGVTYTSTDNYINWTDVTNNTIDTNAKENIGKVDKNRKQFNEQFEKVEGNTVTGSTGTTHTIDYSTVNEEGYVPQSIYKYDSSWMAIESSTEMIDLSNYADATIENLEKLQIQLNHINLGLKGRDVFDLELTSDVYSTKVTVNGVDGTYNYNSNKVTVRRNDCNNYNYREDSANVFYEDSYYEGNEYEQRVRESDINVSKTNANKENYNNTGLAIEVTYKITVKNASQTAGTAIKVSNYYDKKYTFKGAYSDSSCSNKLSDATGSSGTNYNSVVITTPGTQLNQSDTMEIYVVYSLNNAVDTLNGVEKLATYNMAEITAYKTINTGNEATRGLLDKDSAPGSAATEYVRLHPDTILENTSTVDYYFGGNDLSKLKYEDDTYATPTLYFVKDSSERKITGTVFEDKTITDKTTKIKTGNGKLDAGEVGVYGATVQLIEKLSDTNEKIRYETTTSEGGTFEFSGFLPGNYIIRYYYGDKVETALLHQSKDGSVNKKSYNGEDFQATNNGLNAHPDNAIDPRLSNLENYWYAINETDKISTGFDDSNRRLEVSNNVIKSDEIMTVLNNMRDGKSKDDCEVTYTNSTGAEISISVDEVMEKTNMCAETQQMLLTVEESFDLNQYDTNKINGKYSVIYDNKITIATWTVFPNEKDEHYKEYKIENMNFGIAEVPVTTVDLSKSLNKFIITDSTGQNVIASFNMDDEKGKVGFVTVADDADGRYWAQIEDEKLQGARLEITYDIKIDMNTEINFDVKEGAIPTITGMVDFIDNSLSYNENLGQNKDNWEVTTYNGDKGLFKTLEKMKFTVDDKDTTTPKGTVDPSGEKYTTIIKATDKNQLLLTTDGTVTVPITLEKVLSSTNSTIEEIITSTVQSYEYSNTVEIVGIDYSNTKTGVTDETEGTRLEVMRDRVRTKDRYIILPGVQHDSATSETLVITPPTGDSSISITYYIIAVISLAVLAVGVFGIKKYVIKK